MLRRLWHRLHGTADMALDPVLPAAHMNLALSSSSDIRPRAGPICVRHLRDEDRAEAARHLREAARLGEHRVEAPLTRLRQELFVAANEDGTIRFAIDAVLDATTVEDFEDLLDRFPFAALPDFIDSFAAQSMLPGMPERVAVPKMLARP